MKKINMIDINTQLAKYSDKELKEMLRLIEKRNNEIKDTLSNNKEIKEIAKEIDRLKRIKDNLNKQIKVISDTIRNKILKDDHFPEISQNYYSFEKRYTNIKDIVFEAIKKSGFRRSNLLNTQIVDFTEYVWDKLNKEDKRFVKLEKDRAEIKSKIDKLDDKLTKIKNEIREKIREEYKNNLIGINPYYIEKELESREKIRKGDKKEKKNSESWLEREKFDKSYDDVFRVLKKLMNENGNKI